MSDTTAGTPDEGRDSFTDPALDKQTVTNDAVAGEPVIPTGHYAGPTGSEPLEGEPEYAENDLAGEEIDLDETEWGLRPGWRLIATPRHPGRKFLG